MSDYVHKTVIRLPFPKQILETCNTQDPWDCETYLKEHLGDLYENKTKNSFELECTYSAFYIDWVYYYTYGDSSGDWGHVRPLTQNELDVIKPYFDKLSVPYKDEDLRRVDYCFYNSCEAPDYYELVKEENDDSSVLINRKER